MIQDFNPLYEALVSATRIPKLEALEILQFQSSIRGFSFCYTTLNTNNLLNGVNYFNPLYEALVSATIRSRFSGLG